MPGLRAAAVVERLLGQLQKVEDGYHRLVLVVGPVGEEKATVLRRVAERVGGRFVNVNLDLSRRLLELDLSAEQRARRLPEVLDDLLGEDTPVFLARTEILFDPALRQDPLRLLRQISRVRTVVAAWSGEVDGGFLTYAEPGHPEYQRLPHDGVAVVEMGGRGGK